MSTTANRVDFRRLELRDLNAIEKIERASYRTPWSRSMFAGELAKPSSISLGAFDPERSESFLDLSVRVVRGRQQVARLPDHQPLRRRVACDEPCRRAEAPPQADRRR